MSGHRTRSRSRAFADIEAGNGEGLGPRRATRKLKIDFAELERGPALPRDEYVTDKQVHAKPKKGLEPRDVAARFFSLIFPSVVPLQALPGQLSTGSGAAKVIWEVLNAQLDQIRDGVWLALKANAPRDKTIHVHCNKAVVKHIIRPFLEGKFDRQDDGRFVLFRDDALQLFGLRYLTRQMTTKVHKARFQELHVTEKYPVLIELKKREIVLNVHIQRFDSNRTPFYLSFEDDSPAVAEGTCFLNFVDGPDASDSQ